MFLKKSTAVDIVVGPFVDDKDGATLKTGLAIAQADVQLSKNAGSFAQKNDATSATHLKDGQYKVPLSTTDTNTNGYMRVSIVMSGCLPVWAEYLIVPANVYDSLVGGSASLDVSATSVRSAVGLGSANLDTQLSGISSKTTNLPGSPAAVGSAMTLSDGAITAAKIASNAITDAKIATDAIDVTKISDGTIAASKIAIDAVAKIQSGLATSNALSTTDGKVDAVKAKTDNLPPSPAAVGSAMTLTSAYDKAKDDVLTPLGVIDGKADAIKLQTDKIPNTPAVTGEYTSALTAIQADLNDPDQYKADVSALAKVTDLSGLAEKTDIPSDYAKANDLSGLAKTTDITALNNLSAAEMLNEVVVGTFTLREILTILAAKSDGYPATGGGTTTITYGGIDGTPGVIVETVDEDGNRSKVEFNL